MSAVRWPMLLFITCLLAAVHLQAALLPSTIPAVNGSTVVFDPSTTDAEQNVTLVTTCTSCAHMRIVVRNLSLAGNPQFNFAGPFAVNLTLRISWCTIEKETNDALVQLGSTSFMSNITIIIESCTITHAFYGSADTAMILFTSPKTMNSTVLLLNVSATMSTSLSSMFLWYVKGNDDVVVVVENSNFSLTSDQRRAAVICVTPTSNTVLRRAQLFIRNTTAVLSASGSSGTVSFLWVFLLTETQDMDLFLDRTTFTVLQTGQNGGGIISFTLPSLPSGLRRVSVQVSRSNWTIVPAGSASKGCNMIVFQGLNRSAVFSTSIILTRTKFFQTPMDGYIAPSKVTVSRALAFPQSGMNDVAIVLEAVECWHLWSGFYAGKAYYSNGINNVSVVVRRSIMYVMRYCIGFNGGPVMQNVRVAVEDSAMTAYYGGPVIDFEDYIDFDCSNISLAFTRSHCATSPNSLASDNGVPCCVNLEHVRSATNVVFTFTDSNLTASQNVTSPFTTIGIVFMDITGLSILVRRCTLTIYLNSGYVVAATLIDVFASTVSSVEIDVRDSSLIVRQGPVAVIFAASIVLVDSCPTANDVSVTLSNVTASILAMTIASLSFQAGAFSNLQVTVTQSVFNLKMQWPFPMKPLKNFYGAGFFTVRSNTAATVLGGIDLMQLLTRLPLDVAVNVSAAVAGMSVRISDTSVTLTPAASAQEIMFLAIVENASVIDASIWVNNVSVSTWKFLCVDNATASNVTVVAQQVTVTGALQHLMVLSSVLPRALSSAHCLFSRVVLPAGGSVRDLLSVDSLVAVRDSSFTIDQITASGAMPLFAAFQLAAANLQGCVLSLSRFVPVDKAFVLLSCTVEPCVMSNVVVSMTSVTFPQQPAATMSPLLQITRLQYSRNVSVVLDRNMLSGVGSLAAAGAMWDGSSLVLRLMCNTWNGRWLTSGQLEDIPPANYQLLGYTAGPLSRQRPFNRPHCPTTPRESMSHTYTVTSTATTTISRARPRPDHRFRPAPAASSTAATVLLSGAVPGSAIAMQRAQTMGGLALCQMSLVDPLDSFSSPTQLFISPEEGGYLRGAVVGNVVVIWGGSFLLAIAASAAIRIPRTVWGKAAYLSLPGRLIVLYTMLVVPTVSSAVSLLLNVDSGRDQLLAVAVLIASAAPFAAVFYLTVAKFGARPMDVPAHQPKHVLDAINKALFGARTEWVNAVPRSGFVEHYSLIFEPYRRGRHWYVCVELATALLFGVLGGAFVDDGATCHSLLVVACVANVVGMLSLAVRPYDTHLDMAMAVANAALNLLTGIYGLQSLDPTSFIVAQAYLNNAAIALVLVQLATKGYICRAIDKAKGLLGLVPLRRPSPKSEPPAPQPLVLRVLPVDLHGMVEDDPVWHELKLQVDGQVVALNKLLLRRIPSIARARDVAIVKGPETMHVLEGLVGLVCACRRFSSFQQRQQQDRGRRGIFGLDSLPE